MVNRKEQFERVNEIITRYHLYLDYLGSKNNFILAMNDKEDKDEIIKYVASVYRSYNSLSKEEKETITNEFFISTDPDWWRNKYNEAHFKLVLFSGINNFLKGFENAI